VSKTIGWVLRKLSPAFRKSPEQPESCLNSPESLLVSKENVLRSENIVRAIQIVFLTIWKSCRAVQTFSITLTSSHAMNINSAQLLNSHTFSFKRISPVVGSQAGQKR
jgi:hypothetical protein